MAFSLNCQSLCHQLGLGLEAGDSDRPEWQGGGRCCVHICELTTTEMMLLLSFSKYNRFLEFQVTGKLSTFVFKSVLERLKQNEKYKTNHFALKNYTQVFIYYSVILTVYITAVTLKEKNFFTIHCQDSGFCPTYIVTTLYGMFVSYFLYHQNALPMKNVKRTLF